MKRIPLLVTALLFQSFLFAQQPSSEFWKDANVATQLSNEEVQKIVPKSYRALTIDKAQLQKALQGAPLGDAGQKISGNTLIDMPMPDGTSRRFRVMEVRTMHPDLAARYPHIKAYAGIGVKNPGQTIRFEMAPGRFNAMIHTDDLGVVVIDPVMVDANVYLSYLKRDYPSKMADFTCETDALEMDPSNLTEAGEALLGGDCMHRKYRLALACTGEYAQFHGGTVNGVLAEMNTAVNRINGIYEREFTVTLELIANNDDLIYLNGGNDPYTNGSSSTMLAENQSNLDSEIGEANYDIGHVFGTGNGGIASIRSACDDGRKARGTTALPSPIGDPFYVDYVAHEIGHSFGANHTFNNLCGGARAQSAAIEPGSGTTIMSYAGICAPDIENQVDDNFHAYSLVEINAYITSGIGDNCPVKTASGNNAPEAIAPADRVLPVNTPFVLTGMASDADGNASLTYTWEQMDNEIAVMPPDPTSTGGPAFRALPPGNLPSRYFPNLNDLASGNTATWEVLPSVSRFMKFRFSVRDNNPGAGCVDEDDIVISFSDEADNFQVMAPNGGETWEVSSSQTITWDVANTDASPVDCQGVDILLSKDGGLTFPVVIATDVPNNGSYNLTVPNEATANARIFVKGNDNYFFDISDQDFEISLPQSPTFLFDIDPVSLDVCTNETAEYNLVLNPLLNFNESITLSINGLPSGANVSYSQNPVLPAVPVTITIDNLAGQSGNYTLELVASSASVNKTANFNLNVFEGAPPNIAPLLPADGTTNVSTDPNLSWQNQLNVANYYYEIATNPGFGAAVVASGTIDGTSVPLEDLELNTIYYWRVKGSNPCGEGGFSTTFAFRTENPECLGYFPADVPVTIFNSSDGSYTSTINIPDSYIISDLNLLVVLEHSWIGDLSGTLRGPDGTVRTLFDRPGVPATQFGCGENNMRVVFDDSAANTAATLEATCNQNVPFAIDGVYRSSQSLSAFNNDNINGNWILTITDNAPEDGGFINNWAIEACRSVTPVDDPVLVENNLLTVVEGATGNIDNTLLEASSSGNTAAQISFVLRNLPAYGELRLGGFALNQGDVFTQQEINDGFLTYVHTGGSASDTDAFIFDVFNLDGGWLAGSTFNISILTNSLAIDASISSELDCYNDSDAAITANANGGTPPFEYRLNNGAYQGSNVFTGLSAGNYTITVRDANNFTRTTGTITISNPDQLTVTASVVVNDVTANGQGGTGALEYSLNGVDFQSSNTFENIPVGNYTLTVRDANGCLATTPVVVAGTNLSASLNLVQDISCNGDNNGIVEVTAGGGQAPYEYSLNGGAYQSGNRFENLASGDYTVEVRDNLGTVTSSNTVTVTEPPLLELSTSVNLDDVTLSGSGGTGNLEYSIDGTDYQPGNVFQDLANGNYTGYVRDENDCLATTGFTILVNNMMVQLITSNPISCNGSNDGSVSASVSGGTPPYDYSLNGGPFQSENTFENLGPGMYTVDVRDNDGLISTTNPQTLTEPDELTVSTDVNGYDVTVNVSGGTPPFEYSFNGSAYSTNNFYQVAMAGNFIGTVRDANGCEKDFVVNVDVDALTISGMVTEAILCYGEETAEITLSGSGGVPPYEYSIDGTEYQSSPVFGGLGAGNITVYIRDAGGFVQDTEISITEPNPLTFGYDFINGDLVTEGLGGTAGYQFSFAGNPYSNNTTYPNVMPGETVRVIVKDANDCEYQELVTVPIVTLDRIDVTDILCFGDESGGLAVQVTGGIAPLEFSLDSSNWQVSNIFENLAAGNYTVYVRDAGGFGYSFSASITEPDALDLTVASVAGGTVTLTAAGGIMPYQYSIDGSNFQSGNVFSDVPAGDYVAYVEDANGCRDSVMVSVSAVFNIDVDLNFEVMPNPSRGNFTLKIQQPTAQNINIRVYDMVGKLYFDRDYQKSSDYMVQAIQLQHVQAGSYMLVISDGSLMGRRQLLILK